MNRIATPELDLVCACLAPQPRALPPLASCDENLLVRVVRRHQVAALVAERFAEGGQSVPPAIARMAQRNRAAALRQIAAATALRDGLARADVDALFLKGLALSQRLYGSPLMRRSVDIDVLVAKHAVAAAQAMLDALGYARINPPAPLAGARLALFRWASKDSIHRDPRSGITVELHWRMSDEMPRAALAQVGGRQSLTVTAGEALDTLADKDLFVLLCTHGAAHGWSRLKWLVDVAALLDAAGPQAAELWQHARSNGAEIAVASAILLAKRLFGQTPPAGFSAPKSLRLDWLVRLSLRIIALGDGALEVERSRWRGWAEMAAKLLVVPGLGGLGAVLRRLAFAGEDIAALALPWPLFWLYPLLRGPMLLRRRWQRGQRHAERLRRPAPKDNTAP